MKNFLMLTVFISFPLLAQYQKPKLIARYSGPRAWNAMEGMSCFGSEPLITHEAVYLDCNGPGGFFMASFTPEFHQISQAMEERLFSRPQLSQGKVSWFEFDEGGLKRLFEIQDDQIKSTALKNFESADYLTPLSHDSWAYRTHDSGSELWMWKEGKQIPFFTQDVAYIFPPVSDEKGGVVMKIREVNLNENAPDRLWTSSPEFKIIMEDKDANPSSPFLSFRHQLAVDHGRVALVAQDAKSEVLILWEKGTYKEVARVGVDVKSFDYFSPKMRAGALAFRGVDFQDKKVIWVYRNEKLQRLLSEGDIVHTDLGPARISYKNQDAIFYGAPGIGPQGEIFQQATLSDADYPETFMGIGLIKMEPK